ncbi:MAG: N-acetylmuramoyl-L-alanine amidase [Clostridia bacterium]|nr:N-acetylmuramoyl-L-alanine amidase [Clostridia bacterium]
MKRIFILFFAAIFIIYCSSCKANVDRNDYGDGMENDTENKTYLSDVTVIIDAGHGGEDGGAVGKNGVLEKDINLSLSLMLESMLREKGYKTLMTRTEDILLYDRNVNYQGHKKQLDLEARLNIAEKTENAIFVSIHMNSFSQEKYKGLQVYYSTNSTSSKFLADEIQLNGKLLLDTSNNRVTKPSDKNILLLDKITHPAVLVECGFLSNASECEKLSSSSYQKEVANSICISIINYLGSDTSQKNENNADPP